MKVICKNSEVGQRAPVEAVINNEQAPEPVEASAKDQQEFGEDVEKLVAPGRNKVKKLPKRYTCAFTMNNRRQGRIGMARHEFYTGEARFMKQARGSIPLAKRKASRRNEEERCNRTIIRSSKSTRFGVDSRKLNDVSKNDSYPLPRIDDTLERIPGKKWFSTLNLQSGYWQVEWRLIAV